MDPPSDPTPIRRGRQPRGRPRDPSIESRAVEATRTLLLEAGYNGLSMDLVARRASVSRPTLYLRWPSKAHLVYASLFPGPIEERRWIVDTGDLDHDVRTFLSDVAGYFSTPIFRAGWPGLLADFGDDPLLRESVISEQWHAMRDAFVARVQRGESGTSITPRSAIDLLDVLIGALYQRTLVMQEPLEGFVEVLARLAINWVHVKP